MGFKQCVKSVLEPMANYTMLHIRKITLIEIGHIGNPRNHTDLICVRAFANKALLNIFSGG